MTGQLNVAGAIGYTPVYETTSYGIFHLAANGSYTYTLTSPVHDGTAGNGADTVPGVETLGYTAHDANGNTVNGAITIDVVHISEAVSANVDDDGLTGGNPASGPNGPASFSATLDGVVGGDGAGTHGFSFSLIHGSLGTVGLEKVQYSWNGTSRYV